MVRWCRWLWSWLLVPLALGVAALASTPAVAGAATSSARPQAFSSCASLVGYAQRHFAVTHGVPDPQLAALQTGAPRTPDAVAPGLSNQQTAASAPAAGAAPATQSFSTTNDQEAGVDEPDIVKTNGRTLYVVSQNMLYAVSVGSGGPNVVGSLALGNAYADPTLLLNGTRLIVITSSAGPSAGIAAYPSAATTVSEVDVHDPAAMRVTRTLTIDGTFVDARQNGSTARLVISSAPRGILIPDVRMRSTAAAWVPRRRFHSALTGRRYVRPAAACDRIRRPSVFSGLGMVTILTLDLDRGLYTADSQALMADAQVVYGSTGSLYVATQKWIDPRLAVDQVPPSQATVINRFDVSDPTRTTLVATGTVPGYLLNQFSLSEFAGYLRVATTSRPIWWGGGPPASLSSSAVTVLARSGASLVPVGRVSGLGAGQQIYSVRFVDDTGYVVTFRQIDPLYTIDLRNPASPRVAGQLELAGYSSYLQPLAPGLLLGIGQDVGGNEPSGSQLELFDVSDPAAPRLVKKVTLGAGSSSEVQYDHHALLYWPPTGLALLPVVLYPSVPPIGIAAPGQPVPAVGPGLGFVGAIGFHVDRSGIAEVGRITHPTVDGSVPTIRRSVVVGDRIFTISAAGVLASSLDTLAASAFAAFPAVTVIRPPGPIPVPLAGRPG
jgi:uncharacterized secreted protein with C-terminal beta-propeller domain